MKLMGKVREGGEEKKTFILFFSHSSVSHVISSNCLIAHWVVISILLIYEIFIYKITHSLREIK